MKIHEKVSSCIEIIIDNELADYVDKDLGDTEVRHELINRALDSLYDSEKIERIAEQIQEDVVDSLDFVLEHYGFWDRLANIVMCMAQDVEEPTWHVEDHRREVL